MPFDMQDMLGKLTNSIPALQEENARARSEALAIQHGLIDAVKELTRTMQTEMHGIATILNRIEAALFVQESR